MRRGSIGASFLVFLALAVSAASEEPPAREGPCRADAERYCGSVGKEKGARIRCLRKHQAELSPACQERVESRKGGVGSKRIGGMDEPCGDDLRAHCPDIEKKKRERGKAQPES
jgi:hypothetical protein